MTEIAGRTVYKNMKIWSMRTITASVKNVYVNGEKVQSAVFGASTKPIFRSESAHYVLLIQMSKEMWDFDASGSGEIMFSKAINGFLPELFKRWHSIDAKHLVTVVLFTRIEYDTTQNDEMGHVTNGSSEMSGQGATGSPHKDYYRVVVSDMASAEGEQILGQLKAEFKAFLRDVCICQPRPGNYFSFGSGFAAASTSELPEWIIRGQPTSASRGNILEAITIAVSQFSSDYIDRDFVRTGVSVAIVTPGTGVFEVHSKQLLNTTNNLIANGIGIDLICLSRMPLHSVPLFKYKTSIRDTRAVVLTKDDKWNNEGAPSSTTSLGVEGSSATSQSSQGLHKYDRVTGPKMMDHWSYAIPHWIDVSYWTATLDEVKSETAALNNAANVSSSLWQPRKTFRPRLRMYELQMMGIMEDAMDDISIPYLRSTIASRYPTSSTAPGQDLTLRRKVPFEPRGNPTSSRAGSHLASTWAPAKAPKGESLVTMDPGQFMNTYDEQVFLHPEVTRVAGRRSQNPQSGGIQGSVALEPAGLYGNFNAKEHHGFDKESDNNTTTDISKKTSRLLKQSMNTPSVQNPKFLPKPAGFSRQLSFGLRGFSTIAPKAIASTELSAEHAKSPSLLGRTVRSSDLAEAQDALSMAGVEAVQHRNPSDGLFQDASIVGSGFAQSIDRKTPTLPRPILNRKNTAIRLFDATTGETQTPAPVTVGQEACRDPARATQTNRYSEITLSGTSERSDDSPEVNYPPSDNALTPWMTVINPCNPPQADVPIASRLGRWQHIFPRHLRASKIKWRSLCSPAAMPITTDDIPDIDELANNYQQAPYIIFPANDDELSESPRSSEWLLREMVAIRLSHGFQMMIGHGVARSLPRPEYHEINVFDKKIFLSSNLVLHLSKSNLVHQLKSMDNGGIEVKRFCRVEIASAASDVNPATPMVYRPAVRTMLAGEYKTQEVHFDQQHGDLDWQKLDSFLAETGKQQPVNVASALRFWRARFVLIPVDPPANSRRPLHSLNEDSEEEMRLEGIQRLTQIWQKFRYVPPAERRFQVPLRRRKDTNPLDIMYQTRNPSAIIAAEKGNIGDFESAGGAVELLPESELYQRSDLNLASLAQTIQSDKGIRMVDRRWHWRLHYSCFIGSEMTTWLLQNLRDIETREEAVELGNELMQNGLFHHVEQRHNFRDGNYFYQIASGYRTPRPESRSWFGTRKSVPATPISEVPNREFPNPSGSRPSSNSGDHPGADAQTPIGEKQRLGVALSKSLLYDVDHRKRSHRRELITIHYDRLHNPDNCYHVRIEWMNVTSKLIEDAIVSWATTVDRYGLKLVQVPLAEASATANIDPFRAPYVIQLARCPPSQQPETLSYLDARSFSHQTTSNDAHLYQKAILKRFRYVLDFEAACDFPSNVDVAYSWGKPDYKYAQYIHHSGVLLVQITGEGHFLLLANRLYNNRNAASQETVHTMSETKYQTYRNSAHLGSPRASPYSSPIVRPKSDAPTSGHQGPILGCTTPEQLKNELETFCKDGIALDRFYDEMLHKVTVSGRHTPYMESSIPTLGLPPSLSLGNESPAPGIGGSISTDVEAGVLLANDADARQG